MIEIGGDFLKFIFPQNYNFKNKIFGVIDYSVAILNLVWDLFVFLLLQIFISDINIKIVVFIIFCFPIFLLSISGVHGENIIYILIYFFKFLFRQKLFFFSKTDKYR